jgi:arginine-tRNA-protein transferase
MESVFRYVAPAGTCGYLPDQTWRLEYELALQVTPAEYLQRMEGGWRRFGISLFRPRCPSCRACQPLRVVVDQFRPNRSQRRVRKLNETSVVPRVGTPLTTRAKLELYDRYHARQAKEKGWPEHARQDVRGYTHSFVENPFPTQEWCYFLGRQLAAVAYVDSLPGAMSAIYCFYDPDLRQRSLGTWNILCLLEEARRQQVPHLYLGYYVAGCSSMEYKTRFQPNEVLGSDGQWRSFAAGTPGMGTLG